jgi:aspartate 1-decarboxylase
LASITTRQVIFVTAPTFSSKKSRGACYAGASEVSCEQAGAIISKSLLQMKQERLKQHAPRLRPVQKTQNCERNLVQRNKADDVPEKADDV